MGCFRKNYIWRAVLLLLLAPAFIDSTSLAESARETVVDLIRQSPPKDIVGRLTAIDQLLDVGAFDEANEYLQQVLDSKLNPQQWAEAERKVGSPLLVRLIRTPQVAKLGAQVARRVSEAVAEWSRDPQRIARVVESVSSDDEDARIQAFTELARIGPLAAVAVLEQLRAPGLEADRRQALRDGLARIGQSAVPPLVAALTAADSQLLIESARALGHLQADQALPYLLRPSLDPHLPAEVRAAAAAAMRRIMAGDITVDQATRLLRSEVDRLIEDPLAVAADVAGVSQLWLYQSQSDKFETLSLPSEAAALLRAAELAEDALRLDPGNRENRQRYLATQLGWAKLVHGLDQPLPADVVSRLVTENTFDAEEVQGCVLWSLQRRMIPSTVAAVEVLGAIASVECLRGVEPSPLVRALRSGHPRVRSAAAEAILRIDPQEGYVGASDLIESLAYAASAKNERIVIVAHPLNAQLDLMSGWLTELGYRVLATRDGKQALRWGRVTADVELILVSDRLWRPAVNEVADQLAFDRYTRTTPICILAHAGQLPAADRVAARGRHTTAFPLPHDRDTMVALLQQALAAQTTYPLSPALRLAMADRSLKSVSRLLQQMDRYAFYEFLPYQSAFISALDAPPLAQQAAAVLGHLATPAAQTALVEFVGRPGTPLANREGAAQALDIAVRRVGIMLTSDQIQQQYRQYNANLIADKQTASVLSSVLDSLERSSQIP